MDVVLVAAVAANGVIGRGNALPWRLKSDLMNFRAVTMGKPLVMGRKTYQSIGKPLKDRTNIVITRDPDFAVPGVLRAASFEDALDLARKDATARGTDQIMIIGGSGIFAVAMSLADRLEITHVHAAPEGNVTFPPIDPRIWREVSRSEYAAGPQDDASFAVATYIKR